MPDVTIAESLERARQRLTRALASAGRDSEDACLLAVSKTHPAASVRQAFAAGQRAFGENYLQEALDKQASLDDLEGIVWHFIGPLQSNKTRAVAEHFQWVHTIDRERIATRLDAQRPAALGPLDICLQVNVSGETSKSGVSPEALPALADAVIALPHLRLRGLMALPAPSDDPTAQRRPFAELRTLLETLRQRHPQAPLDTLSMGMSGDLEAAILEGATLVRLGTAIFGQRAPHP
ncbi:YggS family pyridoxal phosphate-dependent enzyme [Chromohalobacter nigrandesensis]|uniref:YggS family pyridoxal phosphate-dependent enzyme n=1 Tax=Chromohalobacter nigrandesensis TaxID=119863 RepID=UPI001FF67FCB|nr:YggS family pyridoxal phosphate-dependent enzyme [Chromohalobacter nigrandesensis]MCK0744549.1 YggS family pyridoxal phosphate-dependent enzyme [Chromohalobacter nigrandesensis]